MKIDYVGRFQCDIVLDGDMVYHGMNREFHALQDYIDKATYLMGEYGFVSATIYNTEDGLALIKMECDCNDFPNTDVDYSYSGLDSD